MSVSVPGCRGQKRYRSGKASTWSTNIWPKMPNMSAFDDMGMRPHKTLMLNCRFNFLLRETNAVSSQTWRKMNEGKTIRVQKYPQYHGFWHIQYWVYFKFKCETAAQVLGRAWKSLPHFSKWLLYTVLRQKFFMETLNQLLTACFYINKHWDFMNEKCIWTHFFHPPLFPWHQHIL